MATTYPTSKKSFTNPTSTDTLDSPDHAALHADKNDTIEALEDKVGIDGDSTTTSHDYILTTGWKGYTAVTPTYTSTTNGIDTISFASVDVTGIFEKNTKVKITSSSGTHTYFCTGATFSTNTTVTLVGETSVSGTISAVWYSYADNPYGFIPYKDFKASAYNSSATTMTNGASTKVGLQTESYDPNGDFDSATNYRYTAPITGYYEVRYNLAINLGSASAACIVFSDLYLNGASVSRGNRIDSTLSSAGTQGSAGGALLFLNRDQYLELYGYQLSGADRSTENLAISTYLHINFDSV